MSAKIDLWKFSKFLSDQDTVIDFGCGGGYLLAALPGGKKYGVELNPVARKNAEELGINALEKLDDVTEKVDRIISNHVLEHTDNPLSVLGKMLGLLKEGGLAVIVLPIDEWRNEKKYYQGDINQHLYTWTPLLAGNLFSKAGFDVERVEILTYSWIPFSRILYGLMPNWFYKRLCYLWALVIRDRQLRIIARKK